MFNELVSLFSGWYQSTVTQIRDLLSYQQVITTLTPDGSGQYVTQTIMNEINPEIWSAYVPWEQIIASVALITFVVCLFKLVRSCLCKIL